ncbi:MAG: hypothetical protein AB7I30_12015, partial [Isosphaeraceae bacterium]
MSSETYGGTPLTQAGFKSEGTGKVRSELWYLTAPVVGTANVVVTMAESVSFVAGSTVFSNVAQTSPFSTVTTGADKPDPSITVTSAVGELVIDAVADRSVDSEAVGTGQGLLWTHKNGTSSSDAWGGSSSRAGAASVTMSWSTAGSGAGEWAAVVVSLKPFLNTAPTLDASKSPALASINEDAGAPVGAVGTLVSSLVDFASPAGQLDNVTDPDAGASLGIAVTGADTTRGTWFYSINGGANWQALGTVSIGNARLLAADAFARLYFRPNANWAGTLPSAITFRAWDRTSGGNGVLFDTTSNGSATAFSTATDTASLVVVPVADTPSVTNASTLEDTQSSSGLVITRNPVDGAEVTHFKITAIANGSLFKNDGVTPIANGSFITVAEGNAGLRFTPNPNFSGNAGFAVQAATSNTDVGLGGSVVNATVSVIPVNDAPVLTSGSVVDLTVLEDSGLTSLGFGGLSFGPGGGADEAGQTLTYSVTTIPDPNFFGSVYLADGTTVVGIGNYSLAQIQGMGFRPALDQNGGPSFLGFHVIDSGGTANGGVNTLGVFLQLNVTAVNDAPVLDGGGAMTLTPIDEDQTDPSGDSVAAIIASAGGDRITDADVGALEGIAILSLSSGNGVWQYSIDGGVAWSNVGVVSNNSALLLSDTDLVRFVPDARDGATASFTFRAWDQTSGMAGTYADVSTHGGSTAFSADTATATIVVSAVNDTPSVTTTPGALSFNENDPPRAIDPGIVVDDVDAATLTQAWVTISANYVVGEDVLAFTDQLGITGSWDPATGILTLTGASSVANYQAALRDVTYVNVSEDPSILTRTIAFVVEDGLAISPVATRDVTILAVNDAPLITSDGGGPVANVLVPENSTAVTTVTSSDVDGGSPVYSIAGGPDAARFVIDPATGALSFVSAPDFEFPTDADGDNLYEVVVQVSD